MIRYGCLIGACFIVGSILLIAARLQVGPLVDVASQNWDIFWLLTSFGIVAFIFGIVFVIIAVIEFRTREKEK